MLQYKKEFKEKYEGLTDWDEYWEIVQKHLRRCIRVNTLKAKINDIKIKGLSKVPWCDEGFWVKDFRDLGNSLEHQLGYIYIQDAASMLPVEVLKPKGLVLDMCASPGSKTTQMGAFMKNKGLILANELSVKRLKALSANLQRCGCINVVVSIGDARNLKGKFDYVLLDAPCSGSGTIRGETNKSIFDLKQWNVNRIKMMAKIQKKLILKGFDLLKEGGRMIYSTCSLEPEEDEDVVSYLLENRDVRLEKISGIKSKINSDDKEIKKCVKLWPQFYDTEGFFIASVKR